MAVPALIEPGNSSDLMATVRAWKRMVAAGFTLSVRDDRLIVAPADRLTDSQRTYLKLHKITLVELLHDAETLHNGLIDADPIGLAWHEGTPLDWSDERLLAADEVLYGDGRMVNHNQRRYAGQGAPHRTRCGHYSIGIGRPARYGGCGCTQPRTRYRSLRRAGERTHGGRLGALERGSASADEDAVMNAWGQRANAHGASRDALTTYVVNLARAAVEIDGLQTLLLPAERVTAVHEADHAVLHAAQGTPPSGVRIWSDRAGQGYAGTGEFAPEAPALHLDPLHQPHRALARTCVTLAGWAVEWRFERDGFRLGRSLDERVVAGGWVQGAARALRRDPEVLLAACIGATLYVLQGERATVAAVQGRLIRERRVRGPRLAALLQPVRPRDVVARVLGGPPRERRL